MKRVWLLMCILGTLLPYAVFLPWLRGHGLDLGRLVQEATATPIALFAWLDVLLSAVVLLVLATTRISAGRRAYWSVVLGTCLVGVSLGLPLYLYLADGEAGEARAELTPGAAGRAS